MVLPLKKMRKTLAIFSPNENVYSETFIQAHKQLPFVIKYYYGGLLPAKLEGTENLFKFSLKEKINIRSNKSFSLSEHALINSLKREKVDCILAEYGLTAAASLNVAIHLGIPMLVHFHGYDASIKTVLKEYAMQYQNVFNYASAVIAVSYKMKNDLVQLGCPEDKLIISHYGPNSDFLQVRPKYEGAQFVAVGRFIEKKAPYLTIAAFRKVVEVEPGASLIMVGEGDLISTCKALVKAWKLTDHVIFKGVLHPLEIAKLFEQSIAFVQHSIIAANGDSEGTPVAVMEAQAAGLAVVATYHAGIPDIVLHEETGLLVDEYDIDGMAESMIRLIREEGLAQKLGSAGRERVKAQFTIERHLGDLEKVIEEAITKKNTINYRF